MKKVILTMALMAISLVFSGCVASDIYDGAKPDYKGVKEVIKNSPITDKTRERLKKLDSEVTDYDKTRNVVKPIIEKHIVSE